MYYRGKTLKLKKAAIKWLFLLLNYDFTVIFQSILAINGNILKPAYTIIKEIEV